MLCRIVLMLLAVTRVITARSFIHIVIDDSQQSTHTASALGNLDLSVQRTSSHSLSTLDELGLGYIFLLQAITFDGSITDPPLFIDVKSSAFPRQAVLQRA